MNEYLSIAKVCELTTFSVPSIYRMIKNKGFPAPLHINGSSRSVWIRSQVIDWMQSNLVAA